MTKRRPSGDGMVRKREDGRWEGRIVVGHSKWWDETSEVQGTPAFRGPLFLCIRGLLNLLRSRTG